MKFFPTLPEAIDAAQFRAKHEKCVFHIINVHGNGYSVVENAFVLDRNYYHGDGGVKMFFDFVQTFWPEIMLMKGEEVDFLDYTIKMCENSDGLVLMKNKKRPQESYECHLGNFGHDIKGLDSCKQAAIVYFMIARPETFATQLMQKVMRNGSGCMSEYSKFKQCLEKEGILMPVEVTCVDSLNRMIGYKGQLISWETK